MEEFFYGSATAANHSDFHKKTRKRTATFSSGLLDIAAEDRRGFTLRSLAVFVGDRVSFCCFTESSNMSSNLTKKAPETLSSRRFKATPQGLEEPLIYTGNSDILPGVVVAPVVTHTRP